MVCVVCVLEAMVKGVRGNMESSVCLCVCVLFFP